MNHYVRLGTVPAYLLLCLLLGGASAAGFWANMALQLLAIPLLFWAVTIDRSTPMARPARQIVWLLLLSIGLIAVQLIPLPPSLWTALAGRGPVAQGFEMLGQPLPWLPISLSPHRTVASALWLLPACAVLLGIIRLGSFRATWLAWVLAIVTILSVAIGALQIVGGEGSRWYFYRITNYGVTTGFFSNANHMATLLVATIPFLAALYLSARAKGRSAQRTSGLLVVLAGTLTVVFVGLAANRSLAGIGLSVPVLAASLLMILSRARRLPRWTPLLVALLLVGSVALAFSAPFGNNLTGEEARASDESRYTSFKNSLDAAGDFMPLGSGIGTFGEIYPTHEKPAEVTRFYMNHVHSDFIELALETGVPGLAIVLAFLLWWARRTILIWRADEPDYFARAATIASAAILAHSLVDYPLRTAAIGAVFAMCVALMAEPRARVRQSRQEVDPAKRARHLSAD
jgi:O-antigen ligase